MDNPTLKQIRRAEQLGRELQEKYQNDEFRSEWRRANGSNPSKDKNKPRRQCLQCMKWRVESSVGDDGICQYCEKSNAAEYKGLERKSK